MEESYVSRTSRRDQRDLAQELRGRRHSRRGPRQRDAAQREERMGQRAGSAGERWKGRRLQGQSESDLCTRRRRTVACDLNACRGEAWVSRARHGIGIKTFRPQPAKRPTSASRLCRSRPLSLTSGDRCRTKRPTSATGQTGVPTKKRHLPRIDNTATRFFSRAGAAAVLVLGSCYVERTSLLITRWRRSLCRTG